MSDYRVLVAQSAATRPAGTLRTGLERLGYQVVGEVADVVSAVHAARTLAPDLVIFDLDLPLSSRDALAAVRTLWKERTAPVLVLAASGAPDAKLIRAAVKAGVMAYLPDLGSIETLGPHVEIAVARWREIRQLERSLAKARDQLKARALIEQAKGILMETLGLREAEAYGQMRTASMKRRRPMRAIAEAILLAYEAGEPSAWTRKTG